MRYAEAARYLYALAPRGVLLGLDRMELALAQRGNPQRAFASVLVAGTNGKGSVASMLASVLTASGLRVGLYTSPHLHRLTERFRVDGRAIACSDFAARVSAIRPWLERASSPELTFFEICTLLAFETFRDQKCEIAVLEVGLGGRLDATNVVTPLVSVITRLALDHADRLGPTLAHIAREKAGIIKPGVPVITGVREPVALRVIRARARKLEAPLRVIGPDFAAEADGERYAARVGATTWRGLRLPLAGAYQADNLACALATLEVLRERGTKIPDAAVRLGLRRVRWPGRLETIAGTPPVLLDAAHNPDACEALARHLRELRARGRTSGKQVLVFGVLRDKAYRQMFALLQPEVDAVIFATPGTTRGLPAAELAQLFGGRAFERPLDALRAAKKLAGRRGLVVVAGSIFLMSEVRASLLGKRSDPPIAM